MSTSNPCKLWICNIMQQKELWIKVTDSRPYLRIRQRGNPGSFGPRQLHGSVKVIKEDKRVDQIYAIMEGEVDEIWNVGTWSTVGASQVTLVVKNLPVNAGDIRDTGLIPGIGRSTGGGHSNSLQYSWLENSMNKGAWQESIGSQRVGYNWRDLASMHNPPLLIWRWTGGP